MVKLTLTNIMGVPDTYAWNSNGTGKFGGIGLRKVMSNEYPELVDTLCRLEGTITNSTQDASRNWFAELEMAIMDVATDKLIAKVLMQASKDIKCDLWAIINVSVNKIGNHLTNLKQNEEGFESTLLSVEELIVTANKFDRLPTGERVAVGLSDSDSVELLGTALDTVTGFGAALGDTKKFKARVGVIEGTSYQRTGKSNVTYNSTLQNDQQITVMDSYHTQNGDSSQYAKFRTVTSNNCVTSTYFPQNYGLDPFPFNTMAFNSDGKSCAFVVHNILPSHSTVDSKVSANTDISNKVAKGTSNNHGSLWWDIEE